MTEYAGLPLAVKTNPRARRVLVKLVPGSGIEVVLPKGADALGVESILDSKRSWIERTRDRLAAKGVDLVGQPLEVPEAIDFKAMDRVYAVHVVHRPGRVVVTENAARLMVRGPEDDTLLVEGLRRFTVRKAREFLLPRLDRMSRQLGLPYEALRVRSQRTRWGSCSGRGTISLNAKLLFLPPELVDHLLLHELCHTRHLNHSPRFWNLVARHEPDYKQLERRLKEAAGVVPAWFGR